MSIGFPISDGNGHGTDPATMRRILGARWSNAGVIDGCGVGTSSSGLTYAVAAGRAVSTRGTTYGKVEFEVPASTVTTTAGPASGSRIDVVWAKPNDPSQGDADANVIVDVANGVASTGTPAKPTIPTGALELRTYLVPQGKTKTSEFSVQGSVNYAIPYGGSLGVLHDAVNTYNGAAATGTDWWIELNGSFYLPTDRRIRLSITQCVSTADWSNRAKSGSIMCGFDLDGVTIALTEVEYNSIFKTNQFSWEVTVDAGPHSVAFRSRNQWGDPAFYHYGAGSQVGRRFIVTDLGVAQ